MKTIVGNVIMPEAFTLSWMMIVVFVIVERNIAIFIIGQTYSASGTIDDSHVLWQVTLSPGRRGVNCLHLYGRHTFRRAARVEGRNPADVFLPWAKLSWSRSGRALTNRWHEGAESHG